jgi:hypothetical protein
MKLKNHPREEWSDDVLFAELEGYDRIQNKISELGNKKNESLKPLRKRQNKQKR